MDQFIRSIYQSADPNQYELLGPDEEVISPLVWADIIEPDWVITMRMRPISSVPPLRSPALPQETLVKPDAKSVTNPTESSKKKKQIKLRSAAGSTYSLAFRSLCQMGGWCRVTLSTELVDFRG